MLINLYKIIKKFVFFIFKIIFFFIISTNILLPNYNKKKINNIKKFNPTKVIMEHLKDSYEWHFWGEKKNEFSITLPIILWDNGLKFFNFSDFKNINNVFKNNNNIYKIFNGKIYKLKSLKDLKNFKKKYKVYNTVLNFSITKNVVVSFIISLLLLLIFINMKNSYKNYYPNNIFGKILEIIILFIIDISEKNIGKKKEKYIPFLLTTFFFILLSNLFGLIPTFPSITGNISITLTLSLFVFLFTIFFTKNNFWKHLFTIKNIPFYIGIFLIFLDIIEILIKPLTLCIRLFANISSGHIVLLSFICLIFIFKNIFSIFFAVPFTILISLLEILVSFLQAFIFINLSSLFIGMVVNK
ncbi:F0F1 ATP synthase subunit A [Candidatus Shikimatogenerans silvanidophilus]|uniref:F0F1 ATP synthase subunit A n=1 Tax=Candidatus Shikimatogenerans silvanidophilus TaxID=2782547 RepID=UPI002A4E2752|nr:F0F1 ATP synthase subunit A [Candidatus Shikimatogenerans silvanidophilus]